MAVKFPTDPTLGSAAARERGWHVGKEVPLALIAAIGFQTLGLVWYLSKLDSRVKSLEDSRTENNLQIAKILDDREITHTRLTTLEIKLEAILDGVHRIEARLYGPVGTQR